MRIGSEYLSSLTALKKSSGTSLLILHCWDVDVSFCTYYVAGFTADFMVSVWEIPLLHILETSFL